MKKAVLLTIVLSTIISFSNFTTPSTVELESSSVENLMRRRPYAKNAKQLHTIIKVKHGENLGASDMREIANTINRIKRHDTSAFNKDGTRYSNSHLVNPDSERLNTSNNYKEWTVKTPNVGGRAKRRIVTNNETKQAYYSHDHYDSFIEIDLKGW